MFICPNVSELRIYECCHPCYGLVLQANFKASFHRHQITSHHNTNYWLLTSILLFQYRSYCFQRNLHAIILPQGLSRRTKKEEEYHEQRVHVFALFSFLCKSEAFL